MKYSIFGYRVIIDTNCSIVESILEKELDAYSTYDNEEEDVFISFSQDILIGQYFSNNPSIHKTLENGFLADFGSFKILYRKDNNLNISVAISDREFYLNKLLNIGFRLNHENVGQILHELILVPLSLFDKSKALIHASTVKHINNGNTIMFGGTGGAGKTSLELLLCRELGYSFISDDIAVVSKDTKVYPNLSYPKIYAYNVVNNKDIDHILFHNRSLIDRLQWYFMRRYRGENKVRRAISPSEIFKSIEIKKNKVDEYYILTRTNTVGSLAIENLSREDAVKLTLGVIRNEYQSFFQHIIWHEYNCRLLNFTPIITMNIVNDNFLDVYNHIFRSVQCYIVKIPVDIPHGEFLDQMKERFG